MMPEQEGLILYARESIGAAKLLNAAPMHAGFAASRAYYGMYYATQAILLEKEMSFRKHSAVISAFGREFAKTGILPAELHGNLIQAEKRRLTGDYDVRNAVTTDEAAESIHVAEEFVTAVEKFLKQQP